MKKLLATLMLLCSLTAGANEAPIKLVMPFPPGGAWEALARTIQISLGQELKREVVIDYRPGAGAQIATVSVANSDPREVVLMLNGSAAVLNLFKNPAPYQSTQLVPLTYLGQIPFVFVTSTKSNIKTLEEWKNLPANRPVTIGSGGVGSATEMMAHSLNQRIPKNITVVQYKGQPPLLVDLLTGTVDSSFLFLTVAGEHIKSGKLNGVAVNASSRLPDLPNVPTFRELGVPEFGNFSWVALFSNQTTDVKLQQQIQSAMFKILRDPAQLAKFHQAGVELNVKDIVPRKDLLEHEKQKMSTIIKHITIPQ